MGDGRRVLLDTHVVLWWLANDSRLSRHAHDIVADLSNTIFVSAATVWEVAIKQELGRLEVDGDFIGAVNDQGFVPLPIEFSHASETRSLPAIHRDPFDRMLIAQARVEQLHLLSGDSMILRYPVNSIAV